MPNSAKALKVPDLLSDPYLRYRLDVLALDVAGLVAAAGGWLYHRVATGWDVTVAVPASADVRPLQILGVTTADLEPELTAPDGAAGQCLAVVADAVVADARISHRVQAALRHTLTEVVLWGHSWPMDHRLNHVRHLPTAAGRAFKRQALLAADPSQVHRHISPELFLSDQKRSLPADSDLVPVD